VRQGNVVWVVCDADRVEGDNLTRSGPVSSYVWAHSLLMLDGVAGDYPVLVKRKMTSNAAPFRLAVGYRSASSFNRPYQMRLTSPPLRLPG
jgi:hypothetical protein